MNKIDIDIHSALHQTLKAICADLLTVRFKPGEWEKAGLYGTVAVPW